MKQENWLVGLGFSLIFVFCSSVHAFSIPQSESALAASKLAHIKLNANSGDKNAQYLLGLMLLSGRYIEQDIDSGKVWLTKSAEAEHAKAQQTLADLSFDGKILSKDLATAEHWYVRLAQSGNRWAQFRLGFIYASGGQGVMRNCGKALEKFRQIGDRVSLGNVAWILATCPEAEFRNGKEALALSIKLLEQDKDDPTNLDNLAAAYAELGLFKDAINAQQRAITALSDKIEKTKLVEFQQRLQGYQKHQAYRTAVSLSQ